MSVGVLHSRTSLIPLDNFLGAWLVGVIVFVVIFGVTCLQVYNYFTKHCTRDPPFVKVYVVLLLLLDALHLALASHAFYFTTVTNFGDYVRLGIAPWSLLVTIVIGYLSSVQVRSSHAFRIYTISNKQLVVPIIITICAFAELGLGTTFMVKGFHIKAYKNTASQLPYPTSYLSFQVACDVVIAVAMLYYLLKNKSEFQSGLYLPRIWSTYAVFFWVAVRFYALSFMTVLNSREHVREQIFSSHAMVTLPSGGLNDTPTHDMVHENTDVFDICSKNDAQAV